MKDAEKIKLTLRAFKMDSITLEDATKHILKFYSDSGRYNHKSFVAGYCIATLIALLAVHFGIWR
jgi:hypothetical protein